MLSPISIWALAIAAFSLAGCAEYKEAQNAKAAEQIRVGCNVKFPRIRGNMVARVNCLNGAVNRELDGQVDGDLVSVYTAKASLIAVEADAGTISEQTFDLKVAQARSDMYSIYEGRRRGRVANAAALMGPGGAFAPIPNQPYVGQPYIPPAQQQPLHTNCYRIGNTTNCTTQ